MAETQRTPPHYFWTGWFDGQSFSLLAGVFALLSFVDLLATLRLLLAGIIREGNVLADAVLQHSGLPGFAVFKLLLVLLVLGMTFVVDRTNPRLARGVLWGGILLMTVIALRHLAIMAYATL